MTPPDHDGGLVPRLLTLMGIGGATIDWYKSGTRKFHPQGS